MIKFLTSVEKETLDEFDLIRGRISAKRFRAKETDSARLSYARALIQALTAHNNILKDKEIDDVIKRLEALENGGKHDK